MRRVFNYYYVLLKLKELIEKIILFAGVPSVKCAVEKKMSNNYFTEIQ